MQEKCVIGTETIYQTLKNSADRFSDRPALEFRSKDKHHRYTYREFLLAVHSLAAGLYSLGLRKGDRLAILSENRPEWAISDFAAQSLGVITVPFYTTLPSAQIEYILQDSGAKAIIISDNNQYAKIKIIRANIPSLEQVVLIDYSQEEGCLHFQALVGEKEQRSDLQEMMLSVHADDIATLIYTSGTTGEPKGVMLSHTALLQTARSVDALNLLDEHDIFLSFLPLSHIVERVAGYYLALYLGSHIYFSQGVFAIAGELITVKPTIFFCVPRMYEGINEKIMDFSHRMPEKKRKIFDWALATGNQYSQCKLQGARISPFLSLLYRMADLLVLRAIRKHATGGRIRWLISGGAPLHSNTATFFLSLGFEILEGYGLTEFPVLTVNRPGKQEPGTVGPVLPGLELSFAQDGEILARGPSIMRKYFQKPEDTAAIIDSEGWLHTGDIGELSKQGNLRITDRKKDIIVLANGKKVAPQPIELRLKESPWISEIVLLGDRQNAIIAIIAPHFERLEEWGRSHGYQIETQGALIGLTETRKLIKDELDRLSDRLADFEKIKRFSLVDHPFTIESGELTPTLKVRRKFIENKYAAMIEHMVR